MTNLFVERVYSAGALYKHGATHHPRDIKNRPYLFINSYIPGQIM